MTPIRLLYMYFPEKLFMWLLFFILVAMADIRYVKNKYVEQKNKKIICQGLLIFYLLLILFFTIFCRIPTTDPRYKVTFLWSVKEYLKTQNTKIIMELICNVLMFLPIGFLLLGSEIFSKVVSVVGCSFLFSAFIECMQLFFHKGVFEFDDMLTNTIGGLIGGIIFIKWMRMRMKQR